MKEIGGYFELDQFMNKPYYKELLPLNSGRNALLYIVKTKSIKKIFLPYFLCDSVTQLLSKYMIEFEYYHIDENFLPQFNRKLNQDEYLYVVNYYGQITNNKIKEYKSIFKNIILDNVQAFFQPPVEEVNTIYSCRKFFGVSDGAYLSATDTTLFEGLKVEKSFNRMTHILGRYEGSASDYYHFFKESDNYFKEASLKKMSRLTHNILGGIDYEKVINIRNENFKFLRSALDQYNMLNLVSPSGPYVYPLYIENGVKIRENLIKKQIYIPVLWPNVINENEEQSLEFKLSANVLPIPCDQRYDTRDMQYIVEELEKCIG